MPDLPRYRTRAGSLLARERGSTDQLCAGHQQLSAHRHLQDMFMSAMREALCWHLLRDDQLAQACLGSGLNPNGLRNYEDLEQIPALPALVHTPAATKRDWRRWNRVLKHSLCDLGWSAPRRRHAPPGTDPFACSAGHWHLPRVLRWQGERLFTPCYSSCSKLSWSVETVLHQEVCACGRRTQWSETPWTSLHKDVLPL